MSKINRREFLDGSAKATLAIGLPMKNLLAAVPQSSAGQAPPANTAPAVLPGDGAADDGGRSGDPNGGWDPSLPAEADGRGAERAGWSLALEFELGASLRSVGLSQSRAFPANHWGGRRARARPSPGACASRPRSPRSWPGKGYKVYAVRWPVLASRNCRLWRSGCRRFITSARRTPSGANRRGTERRLDAEMSWGCPPGVPAEAQFARRLAENGVKGDPAVINRVDTFPGDSRDRLYEPTAPRIDLSNGI